jgi:hypothetical protein
MSVQQAEAVNAAESPVDAESRAGALLWAAVEDRSFVPSVENLGFMARAEVEAAALVALAARTLGAEPLAAWSEGWEALLVAVLDRAEQVSAAVEGAAAPLAEALRWGLARYGRTWPGAAAITGSAELRARVARWFVSPEADGPFGLSEGWWEGFDRVWEPGAFWGDVARAAADLDHKTTGAARIRPCLAYATPAERVVIAARTFQRAPRWASARLAELGVDAWGSLLDVAESLVQAARAGWGELRPGLRQVAPGLVVALSGLSRQLDRDLDPAFLTVLLRVALEVNDHPDGVAGLCDALRLLPEDARQRVMLEAPYLRWRYLPAVPTATVIEWAVGEAANVSPRSWQQVQKAHPEAAFHIGRSLDELRAIAADALGGLGPVAVPFLIDGMARAVEGNKVVFASALASLRDPAAVPTLMLALVSGSGRVQQVVQEGLAALGDPVLPEIVPLLRDPRRSVRNAATAVLARMEPTADVRAAASQVLLDEDAADVRAAMTAIIDAPARPDEQAALEGAEAALSSSRARALVEELRATDGRSWREHADLGALVLTMLAQWVAERRSTGAPDVPGWYDALLLFEADPLAPWAAARLTDHPRFEPAWLAEVAEVCGDALARPLVWRLKGAGPERRRALLRSVAQWCPAAAVRELVRALGAGDPELRRIGQDGLRAAGDAALGPLREAVCGEDAGVRLHAALVLERLADPESVPALRKALAAATDARDRWPLLRAIVVCQTSAGRQEDRALDRELTQQRAAPLPPFVQEAQLPMLAFRSGPTLSAEARGWLLGAVGVAAERLDWFSPLSVSARLIWALRARLEDRSCQRLLDELRRQSRSASEDEAQAFLVPATALLASEPEVERLAARLSDPVATGPSLVGRRLVFAEGDPRVLFLRTSTAALRAALDLATWCPHPMVMAWCREHVERLATTLEVRLPDLDAAVRSGGWTVDAVRAELNRRFGSNESLPLSRWMQDLRDPTFARVAAGVVLDAIDRQGRVRGRFRWRGGTAVDARGQAMVAEDQCRVSDPRTWPEEELAAWRAVIPDGAQPIAQLWPGAPASGSPLERGGASTGWLPTLRFLRRAASLGYALQIDGAVAPAGRDVLPPGPLGAVRRLVDERWALRLRVTPVTAWPVSGGATVVAPERLRVTGAAWLRREEAAGAPWRAVLAAEAPGGLREALAADLAALDADAEPLSDDARDMHASDPAQAADAEPSGEHAAPAAPAAASSGGAAGWLRRLFGGRADRSEAERAELEAARKRQREAKKRADQARSEAERRRESEHKAQRAREVAVGARWGTLEQLLPDARAARLARERLLEEDARLRRRARGKVAGRLPAAARRHMRDLEAMRALQDPAAPPAGMDPEDTGAVPVQIVRRRQNVVVAANEFLDPMAEEVAPAPPPVVAPPRWEEEDDEEDDDAAGPSAADLAARLLADRVRRAAEARKEAEERLSRVRAMPVSGPAAEPEVEVASSAAPEVTPTQPAGQVLPFRTAREPVEPRVAAPAEVPAASRAPVRPPDPPPRRPSSAPVEVSSGGFLELEAALEPAEALVPPMRPAPVAVIIAEAPPEAAQVEDPQADEPGVTEEPPEAAVEEVEEPGVMEEPPAIQWASSVWEDPAESAAAEPPSEAPAPAPGWGAVAWLSLEEELEAGVAAAGPAVERAEIEAFDAVMEVAEDGSAEIAEHEASGLGEEVSEVEGDEAPGVVEASSDAVGEALVVLEAEVPDAAGAALDVAEELSNFAEESLEPARDEASGVPEASLDVLEDPAGDEAPAVVEEPPEFAEDVAPNVAGDEASGVLGGWLGVLEESPEVVAESSDLSEDERRNVAEGSSGVFAESPQLAENEAPGVVEASPEVEESPSVAEPSPDLVEAESLSTLAELPLVVEGSPDVVAAPDAAGLLVEEPEATSSEQPDGAVQEAPAVVDAAGWMDLEELAGGLFPVEGVAEPAAPEEGLVAEAPAEEALEHAAEEPVEGFAQLIEAESATVGDVSPEVQVEASEIAVLAEEPVELEPAPDAPEEGGEAAEALMELTDADLEALAPEHEDVRPRVAPVERWMGEDAGVDERVYDDEPTVDVEAWRLLAELEEEVTVAGDEALLEPEETTADVGGLLETTAEVAALLELSEGDETAAWEQTSPSVGEEVAWEKTSPAIEDLHEVTGVAQEPEVTETGDRDEEPTRLHASAAFDVVDEREVTAAIVDEEPTRLHALPLAFDAAEEQEVTAAILDEEPTRQHVLPSVEDAEVTDLSERPAEVDDDVVFDAEAWRAAWQLRREGRVEAVRATPIPRVVADVEPAEQALRPPPMWPALRTVGRAKAREDALLRSASARALAELQHAERSQAARRPAVAPVVPAEPRRSDAPAVDELDVAYQEALAFLRGEEAPAPEELWVDPGADRTERRQRPVMTPALSEWPRLFPHTTLTAELASLDAVDAPTEIGIHAPEDLRYASDPEETQSNPVLSADEEHTLVEDSWTAEYTVTPALEGPTRTERLRRMPTARGPVVSLPEDDPELAEEEPSLDAETLRKLRERFGGEAEELPTYHGPIEVVPEEGISAKMAAGLRKLAGWFGRKG